MTDTLEAAQRVGETLLKSWVCCVVPAHLLTLLL
jgi:hypothetical protein